MHRILTSLLLACVFCPAWAQAQDKPNIVVMMVDNLGWGELGVYGGGILRGAETPNLDKLAAEGTRFLNFNVEPQCTPSRSAFMTGRHPIRSGTTKVVWPKFFGKLQISHSCNSSRAGTGCGPGQGGAGTGWPPLRPSFRHRGHHHRAWG